MDGPLTYFVEFLKVSGIWDRFVAECPLHYEMEGCEQDAFTHPRLADDFA